MFRSPRFLGCACRRVAFFRSALLLLVAGGASFCAGSSVVLAQDVRVPLKRLAVDCVTVEDGPRLLGHLLDRGADGALVVAVQRDWLAGRFPAYLTTIEKEAAELRLAQARQLPERIRRWIEQRDVPAAHDNVVDQGLVHVLKEQLERADAELKALEKNVGTDEKADGEEVSTEVSQFVLVSVPSDEVQFVYVQPAQHRRIALFAWQQRFRDVEERSALALARELQEAGVSLNQPVNLADRFPSTPDDDRQWAARQAIFEHAVGRRLDFQGIGETLFRTDHEAGPPDLERLLTELLQTQLQQGVLELLGADAKPDVPQRRFDVAITAAEREDKLGFRVTRLAHDVAGGQARVEVCFVARMPDGSWETIWQHSESADATVARSELEQQIAEDPRVQQVFGVLDSLAGAEGARLRESALRFAAATMAAQEKARTTFLEFRGLYAQRLDRPPLRVSGAQKGARAD